MGHGGRTDRPFIVHFRPSALVPVLKKPRPSAAISSYSVEDLRTYFDNYVDKPFVGRLVGGVEGEPEGKLTVGPLSVGLKLPLINRFARSQAFRFAAWLWLRPNHPCWDDIDSLQNRVGLEKYAFAPTLRTMVLELLREHEALRLWIERRLALLEFRTNAPTNGFEDLQHTASLLRRGLLHALKIVDRGDRVNAMALANQIARDALLGAGQAAMEVLGQGGCPFNANLMLRIRLVSNTVHFESGTIASRNSDGACALWDGIRARHALVILEEAGEPEHAGFWAPLASGTNGEYLPGASEAFGSMIGSAVFKNDLPPLRGFETATENRWHGHMRSAFRERMFVSLPLTVASEGQPKRVLAVLNVNAEPSSEDGWRRAYHRQWLAVAKDRVAQFVEVAFLAHLIKRQCDSGTPVVALDLGADPWQSLPGF